MSKHTPGPWVAETNDEGAYDIEAENPNYVVVCSRRAWPHRAAESQANARLIAAAPELLEAAQKVVAAVDSEYPGKADDYLYDSLGSMYAAVYFAARAAIAKATQP